MIPGNRRIQKAKPAAFSRPSVDLGGHAKREWQDIPADAVAIGDTIPDFGVVASIGKNLSASENTVVNLVSGAGKELHLADTASVKAFHLVD